MKNLYKAYYCQLRLKTYRRQANRVLGRDMFLEDKVVMFT